MGRKLIKVVPLVGDNLLRFMPLKYDYRVVIAKTILPKYKMRNKPDLAKI